MICRRLPGLALLLPLVACAGLGSGEAPACGTGSGVFMRIYTLFFGRAVREGGLVTDWDWASFRDTVITPNLPDGYTVLDADGAWASPVGGRTINERTKMLVVALPDRAASQTAIDQVRAAYRTRFHQQLVGMIVQPGCASF